MLVETYLNDFSSLEIGTSQNSISNLKKQVKQNTNQNSILNFFEKKNQIFMFPCGSTREDHSIDEIIANVELILTTLSRIQLFGSRHKSKFNFKLFFFKFEFPCCSTREDLSIDVSITNVGLILTKPGRFLFSGYGHSGSGYG